MVGEGRGSSGLSVGFMVGVVVTDGWVVGGFLRVLVGVVFGAVVDDVAGMESAELPGLLVGAAPGVVGGNAPGLGIWLPGLLVGELPWTLLVAVVMVICLASPGLAVVNFATVPSSSELTPREKQKSRDKLWTRGTSFGFHPKQVFAEMNAEQKP